MYHQIWAKDGHVLMSDHGDSTLLKYLHQKLETILKDLKKMYVLTRKLLTLKHKINVRI